MSIPTAIANLVDGIAIYVGNIASDPYTKENGVNPGEPRFDVR